MRVLFCLPSTSYSSHQWESLWAAYLASYARKQFLERNLEPPEFRYISEIMDGREAVKEALREFCPDVVGFSCTTPQVRSALAIADWWAKDYTTSFVFGGVHPSHSPSDILKPEGASKGRRVVCIGEGEIPFSNYLLLLTKHAEHHKVFMVDGVLRPEQVQDLDAMPFPDRSLIRNERNTLQAAKDEQKRVFAIFSSRGCMYRCSFCDSKVLWGSPSVKESPVGENVPVRRRSPANVIAEMEGLVRDWACERLKFSDDTWTGAPTPWLMEFARLKKASPIVKDLPFQANVQARSIIHRPEVVAELATAGWEAANIGFESGSVIILKEMDKSLSPADIRAAFALVKKHGIVSRAYLLIGMPSETEQTFVETKNLLLEVQPDIWSSTILIAWPSTPLYRHPAMEGVNWEDVDWSSCDEYTNTYTRTWKLTNARLHEMQHELSLLAKATGHKVAFKNEQLLLQMGGATPDC